MHLLTKAVDIFHYVSKYKRIYSTTLHRSYASDRPCNSWPEWQQPEGHDTGILVYNRALKAKVPLITRRPGVLTWYMCGPTVYDSPHIGHGLCYLRFDIVRRILSSHFGLNVVQVMGITDIDDKIIRKANYFKVNINEISRYFEAEFIRDMTALGIQRPTIYTRVTEHIDDVSAFIQVLLHNGLAYKVTDGSVFFNNVEYRRSRGLQLPEQYDDSGGDVTDHLEALNPPNNDSYNSSSCQLTNEELQKVDSDLSMKSSTENVSKNSTTVSKTMDKCDSNSVSNDSSEDDKDDGNNWETDEPSPGKHHPIDFALWKSSKPGDPSWDSTLGPGRPGWHIECSVMASAIFGSQLDVHSGGIDLLFPHHYCEEAQSCARHSANMWTNYWWHSGHLSIDDEKMSKSIGNVISVEDLLKSHSPSTFRHYALTSHYRKHVMYHDGSLANAAVEVKRIQDFLDECFYFITSNKHAADRATDQRQHPVILEFETTKSSVDRNLRDDFNTSNAFRSVMHLISVTNTYLNATRQAAAVNELPDTDTATPAVADTDTALPQTPAVADTDTALPQTPAVADTDTALPQTPAVADLSTAPPLGRFEVATVRNYVIDLMTMFGMTYDTRQTVSKGVTGSSSSVVEENFPDIMKALLDFRLKVRDYALLKGISKEEMAALDKVSKKRLQSDRAPLLEACDIMRDALGAAALVIKDHKAGASWSISNDLNKKNSTTAKDEEKV